MMRGTNKLSWSVFQGLRVSLKLSQQRGVSKAESDLMKSMHGGQIPIMSQEVMEILDPRNNKLYVDMTFGAGGHTKQILQHAPDARIICLDVDPLAYKKAVDLSKVYNREQIMPCLGKFSEIPMLFQELKIEPGSVDGFLFDVGASSMQFDTPTRGFSIKSKGTLDMRMDQGRENLISARDVVNRLHEDDLFQIIKTYGEEKNARMIAKAIVDYRTSFREIKTTTELAEIIEAVFQEKFTHDKLYRKAHVATKTFMALRIFVNNELNELYNGLVAAHHFLRKNGKCLVLTFHSLEDRIVKRQFHGINIDEKANMSLRDKFRMRNYMISHAPERMNEVIKEKKWTPLFKHAMIPSDQEIQYNQRVRSAKLRAAIKH